MIKNVSIAIQARLGSSRLPAKVLLYYQGLPMIRYLVQRLCVIADDVAVLVPNDEVSIFEEVLNPERCRIFGGDEGDVLSRYQAFALVARHDWIVRLTADNPLIDGDDLAIVADLVDGAFDDIFFTSRQWDGRMLNGLGTKGRNFDCFNRALFQKGCRVSPLPQDREHVCSYFAKVASSVVTVPIQESKRVYPSVDTLADYLNLLKTGS